VPTNPAESFVEVKRWLQAHAELQKAGPEMHEAFVDLAEKVWEGSGNRIVPRRAGDREKHVPFSRQGSVGNLADLRVRRGAIRLALKIPAEDLPSVDPDPRTVPIQKKGRWRPYPRAFDFRDARDIEFTSRLILKCVPKLKGVKRAFVQDEPHRRSKLDLDFSFVRNGNLREVLRSAWKSYVITCGGLVGGLLVDALGRDLEAAAR